MEMESDVFYVGDKSNAEGGNPQPESKETKDDPQPEDPLVKLGTALGSTLGSGVKFIRESNDKIGDGFYKRMFTNKYSSNKQSRHQGVKAIGRGIAGAIIKE
jgi:hypothetical protein